MENTVEIKQAFVEEIFITLKHDYRISLIIEELGPAGKYGSLVDQFWYGTKNVEECAIQIALEKISDYLDVHNKLNAAETITRIEMITPYLFSRELITRSFWNALDGRLLSLKERLI